MATVKDEAVKSIVEGDKTADEISEAVKRAIGALGDADIQVDQLEKLCDEAITEEVTFTNNIQRKEV